MLFFFIEKGKNMQYFNYFKKSTISMGEGAAEKHVHIGDGSGF